MERTSGLRVAPRFAVGQSLRLPWGFPDRPQDSLPRATLQAWPCATWPAASNALKAETKAKTQLNRPLKSVLEANKWLFPKWQSGLWQSARSEERRVGKE